MERVAGTTSQPESPVAQNGDVEPVVAEEQVVPDVVVVAPSPTSAQSGPTPVTSVVASPTSQNGGGGSSQPSESPARSPTADDGGDFVSGSVSLKERGAKKVQKQLADVAARTAAQDVASIKKDKEIKAAAAVYLKDLTTKREQAINNIKADHMREQQEYERTATTVVNASAYTNNQPNVSVTTLYSLDAASNSLLRSISKRLPIQIYH